MSLNNTVENSVNAALQRVNECSNLPPVEAARGRDGRSAYGIAVANGFVGTDGVAFIKKIS